MHAVVRTTVSPYRAVIAPFACLAILPVSRMSGRPPTSTVTEYGAGVLVFSDIDIFLGLRVHAEPFHFVRRIVSAFHLKIRGEVFTRSANQRLDTSPMIPPLNEQRHERTRNASTSRETPATA